ncbi:MAG: hypothetical protein ACREAC_08820, partial [Blastocatellia bacterium]
MQSSLEVHQIAPRGRERIGDPNMLQSAGPSSQDMTVYQRVLERRVYPDALHSSTYSERMDYLATSVSDGTFLDGTGKYKTTVNVTHYGALGSSLLAAENHFYQGNPTVVSTYPAFEEGREFQTDLLGTDGAATVLRSKSIAWQQSTQVSWYSGKPDDAPLNNPSVESTASTLEDTSPNPNLVSTETFQYDQFNNVTDDQVFDYGISPNPGPLLRDTITQYVENSNYTDPPVHIRNLVKEVTVKSSAGALADSQFVYDGYPGTPSQLASEPTVNGHDTTYTTTYLSRGNPTSVTNGLGSDVATTAMQYDLYGNVVSTTDPIGTASADPVVQANHTTTITYDGALQCAFPTTVTGPPPDKNGATGSSAGFTT